MAKKTRSSTGAKTAARPGWQRGQTNSPSRSAVRLSAAHRIVVLHGPETYLRSLYTDQLREALTAAHGDVEAVRHAGAQARVADVLDDCRSFGLMGQHKLVIVDEADQFVSAETRPALERYAFSPADNATLLFRSDTWRAGNLDKAIAKIGVVLKCELLGFGQAAAWAQRRAEKAHGAAIESTAVEALLERVGMDLGRIDAELAKLSAMTAGKPITRELVRAAVGMTREEEVWVIQSRLLGGGAEKAIRAVREALGPSKQPEAMVSFAMIDLARKLHTAARLLRAGIPEMQVSRQAKIWGEAQPAILAAARRADPDAAADLLDSAIESDAQSKTGRADPALALELLAVRFASL